jgi:hypothetical protein
VGLLFVLIAVGRADWGIDRLLQAGRLGQYGLAADRARGNDTVYVGVLLFGESADTVRLWRSTDRGESWQPIWYMPAPQQRLSNLAVRVGAGRESWVYLFWISAGTDNNRYLRAARVSLDGGSAEMLAPTAPGPDTVSWLAATRSFDYDYAVFLFWSDEDGLPAPVRNPLLRCSRSTDFGLTWSSSETLARGYEMPAADCGASGRLYVASRDVNRADIRLDYSLDTGRTWSSRLLTSDSTAYNDMFPSVASTHDTLVGNVWTTYDSRRASSWEVRCASSSDQGGSWTLDQPFPGGTSGRNRFLSALDCGPGSGLCQAVFQAEDANGYRTWYRAGTSANPASWPAAGVLGDSVAANSMTPVVTSYGVGDSVSRGLLLYAGLGPANVWYDAWQFIGMAETKPVARSGPELRAGFRAGQLTVKFECREPGPVRLSLWDATGRQRKNIEAGWLSTGHHNLNVPCPGLGTGTYVVMLNCRPDQAVARITVVR